MRCSMSLSPILRTGATAGGAAGRRATGRSCSSGFRRADGGALRLLARDLSRLERKRNGAYTYTLGPTKSTSGKKRRRRPDPAGRGAMRGQSPRHGSGRPTCVPDLSSATSIAPARSTDRRLTPESVRNLVVRLAELARLGGSFSAHSLRSGYLSEAFDLNIPLPEAMSLSGHRTVQSAVRYYRPRDKGDSRAAHVFERHRRR